MCRGEGDDELKRYCTDCQCQRQFIERSNQAANLELGWEELQAQECRAGEQHLALPILASWLLVQTKFEWAQDYPLAASAAMAQNRSAACTFDRQCAVAFTSGDAVATLECEAGHRLDCRTCA
jgi:hypothetical protein